MGGARCLEDSRAAATAVQVGRLCPRGQIRRRVLPLSPARRVCKPLPFQCLAGYSVDMPNMDRRFVFFSAEGGVDAGAAGQVAFGDASGRAGAPGAGPEAAPEFDRGAGGELELGVEFDLLPLRALKTYLSLWTINEAMPGFRCNCPETNRRKSV
mmetsp:Transcript_65203/g.210227  ORF Transcript_65203/g.210227 Transcript_65203/m.210227 type:complete len:155 (-) Transcript_65203:1210-1674(-)